MLGATGGCEEGRAAEEQGGKRKRKMVETNYLENPSKGFFILCYFVLLKEPGLVTFGPTRFRLLCKSGPFWVF